VQRFAVMCAIFMSTEAHGMAHDEHTKARALASLALGNTPRYVAAEFGIPRTTVRRWQPEARALLAEVFTDADRAALAAVFPGLLQQNGPKKEKW
jgi:hypothetical protein